MKIKAFTLAEVLVTLTIIGVVSSMTVPTLMFNYKEKQAVTGVKKIYSILAEAVKLAELENGEANTWDVGQRDTYEGSKKVAEYIMPYLKIEKDCGNKSGCFYSGTYKNLKGKAYPWQFDTYNLYHKVKLTNGMSLAFWSPGNEYCAQNNKQCGSVIFDINGAAAPNHVGVDVFMLTIGIGKVYPVRINNNGTLGEWGEDCSFSGTTPANGIFCSGWVMMKENLDYLKHEIKWDE